MSQQFTRTWEAAQQSLQTSQKKQKKHHAYKLASPFKGLYWVVRTHTNGLDLVLISSSCLPSIRVDLKRVRHCPDKMRVPGDQTPPSIDGGEEVARDAGGTLSPVGDVISDGPAEPETPTERRLKRGTRDVDWPGTADGVWRGATLRGRLRSCNSARG